MHKSIFFALLTIVLLSASLVRADSCDSSTACGFSIDSTAVPLAATSLWSSTTSGPRDDDRAVYIQNVKDDAAAYVAGSDESALLKEAIAGLRDNGAIGSDLEIAANLISE